jgi:hypothetical protein
VVLELATNNTYLSKEDCFVYAEPEWRARFKTAMLSELNLPPEFAIEKNCQEQ